jgi:hypothetical protein
LSPSAEEITNQQIRTYTPVPSAGPGVCVVCHGAPNAGFDLCYSCDVTIAHVSRPLRLVVPISLTRVDGPTTEETARFHGGRQLHYVLRQYKDDRDPEVRRRFSIQLAALVARFIRLHEAHIVAAAGRPWDAVTIVPSSSGRRTGQHPLIGVIQMVKALGSQYLEVLTPGPATVGHLGSSDDAYSASNAARGRSILLVDDTFTSGARLQSAASALSLAGANVVAGLVIGRVITPEFNQASRELWERASKTPFTFDRCCLEM